MRSVVCGSVVLVSLLFSQGQYIMKQAIILNEGPFGGPVTVGAYDPVSKSYQVFDSVGARFASHVIIDSGYIYVAADSLIIKYNSTTKQKVLSRVVKGVRKLAIWKNELLVTRAEINPLPTYFQVYDKNTFNLIYELSLSERAEGVGVLGDTAYVAINGWGAVGKLARIDLNAQSLIDEIDLGPDGLNPGPVFVSKAQRKVYTVNALNYQNASVSIYDANTGQVSSILLNRPSACVGSVYYLNNIYYQINGYKDIEVFSTTGLVTWDTLFINKSIYGIDIDSINARIWVSETDYQTYGKVIMYSFYGQKIDSFDVGVSPGNFAFEVVEVSGVAEPLNNDKNIFINYDASGDVLSVLWTSEENGDGLLRLTTIDGRELFNKSIRSGVVYNIPLGTLPRSIYTVSIYGDSEVSVKKFVK